MTVMKKLASYRDQAKLTQKQLARLAGVSQSAISHWENGKRAPSIRTLKRLIVVFKRRKVKVNLEDIF